VGIVFTVWNLAFATNGPHSVISNISIIENFKQNDTKSERQVVSDPSRVAPWKTAVFQAVETIAPHAHKDRILN
jgi:hypothetical protein